MKFIWVEVWKFTRNNILKLLLGTVLILLLVLFFTKRKYDVELESVQELSEVTIIELDSAPANFKFYIENQREDIFTNSSIVEEYLNRPELLKVASKETSTELFEFVKETNNSAIVDYNESGKTKIIGISKNGDSHLQEFYVNIGNEKDNLKIADFYFEYLTSDNVPFLMDKNIYVLQTPKIKQLDEIDQVNVINSNNINNYNLQKNLIIGVILGGVISFGVLMAFTFSSKKLVYSFSYSLRADDFFILLDDKLDNNTELENIFENSNQNLVVLSEKSLLDIFDFTQQSNDLYAQHNSILEIGNMDSIKRLVYVIEENNTSREWYNIQRQLDTAYKIPTIIIQINK